MDRSPISTVYFIALGAFALGMASYVTAGLIPMIEISFSVSPAVAAQLVTAFTLAYAVGSPVFVAILPAHRQRSGLFLSLGLFTIANAASALSADFLVLVLWRAVAGVGAGVYLALGIAASASLLPSEQRGKAIAIIMGGMASGTVLGVPLSLLMAEELGWASALWLVAGLSALSLAGLAIKLPAIPVAPVISFKQKLSLLTDLQIVSILIVSLVAAIASLGMYTFIASFIAASQNGTTRSIAPYLWVWGIGGVLGSFAIGPLVDRFKGAVLTFWIMVILALALLILPIAISTNIWLTLVPIAFWGAVGWALQVPQNNELIKIREKHGDGNLAVALNESALYLGSAIGAAAGGIILVQQWPAWTLASIAGTVAAVGACLQLLNLKQFTYKQ